MSQEQSKSAQAIKELRSLFQNGFIGTRADLAEYLRDHGVSLSQPELSKALRLLNVSIKLHEDRRRDLWYFTK